MRQIYTLNTSSLDFSLNNFDNIFSFKKVFAKLKELLEKEQKEILFQKKNRHDEQEYFNFMKFLFSSPDKI